MLEIRKEIRHGTMATDWQGRIDFARLRKERLLKTQVKMKELAIAALIVARGENKRYATGVRSAVHTGPGESFGLVFAESPDVIIYEEGVVWGAEKEHITWIKPENLRPISMTMGGAAGPAYVKEYAKNIFAAPIYRDLKERGIEKEKLGADFIIGPCKAALENLGVTVIDCADMMTEVRSAKLEDEINCMRMAGAIVDIAYGDMIEALRPGMRENEISAIGQAALWKNGVEGVGGVTVRSGPNTMPPYIGRMPTDRIIQPGDLVYTDVFGVSYMGYRTCYYRTFKVGSKPTQQEKDWFKKTRECLYNAIDEIRDGVTTADVAKKWPTASELGLNSEAVAAAYNFGHGIGLAQYEYPCISRDFSLQFPQVIKKGMTIAVECSVGETDPARGVRGACRLENVYAVTERGCENLYALPDDEILIPPHGMYTL